MKTKVLTGKYFPTLEHG